MEYKYMSDFEGSRKTKVTFTIAAQLLKNLDHMAGRLKARSRSELMERVLGQWLKLQAQKKLEEDVALYYRAQSPKEISEDRSWSKIAARSAQNLWDEPC